MKKLLFFLYILIYSCSFAQTGIKQYIKKSVMIPMRDGVKLFTVILSPVDATQASPFLLERTPYGADIPLPDDSAFAAQQLGTYYSLAKEGYIFVYQDIRGKYKSEGEMQIHQPLIHTTNKNAIDESTDTWDTIDWLIKNEKNNNGKAGILGISYPG